jgi:hypothetical protein
MAIDFQKTFGSSRGAATSWDESYVRARVKNDWDGPRRLWVLPYFTKRGGNADRVSEFIWNFKDGKESAVHLAIELLAEAVAGEEGAIREFFGCSVICCVPSSQQGNPSPTAERVCRELSRRFPWLTHQPGLLLRTKTIQRAHLCQPADRPTVQTHLDTITCRDNYNVKGRTVLLFDDVLTRGHTSDACSLTLSCPVVGLFLGKTQ